jgi:hypothetical protein
MVLVFFFKFPYESSIGIRFKAEFFMINGKYKPNINIKQIYITLP